MDSEQFRLFMEQQSKIFAQMMTTVSQRSSQEQPVQPAALSVPVPQPSPLSLEGDMSENFDFFERNWRNYESAIGMDKWQAVNNARKVSVLLSVIGEQARKKYFNFELNEQQLADPEAALAAIKAKVIVKRNIIIDRFDFFTASQLSNELIDDFKARLRILAKVAKLGELENELIAYKVVTANKWPQLRTKMLTIAEITLDKAIDLCRAEEIAARRSLELGSFPTNSEVNKVFKSKGQSKQHVASFAAIITNLSREPAQHSSRRVKQVKEGEKSSDETSPESESESEESEEEYEIGKIFDNSNTGGSVLAELNLKFGTKWKSVLCEVDTGANTSLIGHECLVKLSGARDPQLQPSKFRLQSFGGNPIEVLGQVKVPCRRFNRKFVLVLQVVNVDHRPLLSANASRELGLIKFCNSVSFEGSNIPVITSQHSTTSQHVNRLKVLQVKAQQIVDNHKNLFEGYGKFTGVVALEIDANITPTIQPPRRVPIAKRSQLKIELENLEKSGIIVKETAHTDWRPNLQFVTLDEILPELGKAKVFTTVDAKKGFWHVVLDEPSSKLTTFWTPFGRYRWTRLPFGVAPAPEIFQLKLQEVIQDLKGVECIADDILVYGMGDTMEEALQNHNDCLEKL
ncbi:uncharacterized protein LOC129767070 [Toxorhynchites rutilus septentrionalis]|uniref:uncharacterized protein LOC129767070 n=1 Tax=Toxorhynchites rutilus septentrionalis TaxID=329112 RepID=UPI002479ED48|nr:uncharacterized protein LOC129767070 [Toxorhynchites rutilus septentrionalis]